MAETAVHPTPTPIPAPAAVTPAAIQRIAPEEIPMGATLVEGGAIFRAWAPRAREVYALADDEAAAARRDGWTPKPEHALTRLDDGTWVGAVAGVAEGSPYRFWVVGESGAGFKRDPYARELGPGFPDCDCIAHHPGSYPWQSGAFRPPAFNDLVIYQFHFGVYHAVDAVGRDVRTTRRGRFLDLLSRLDDLLALGVNAIQPLPVQEFPSEFSKGYNGTDYFSPETDYQVTDPGELAGYLDIANALLARHGRGPLALDDVRTGPNQLKLVVDLCHLNGIAVILDVVYNHAGGGFDDASLYFFDRQHRGDLPDGDYRDHIYFSPWGWAGGVVFDFREPGVRRFLIDNARFLLDEFRVDGFRYDEVSVCANHQGWAFCQELADAVRRHRPEAIQIAEYWNDWRWQAVVPPPHGMGFDAAPSDVLRRAVRGALAQAAWGARVDMDAVAGALHPPHGFPSAWRAVQSVEDHDVVYAGREARVAAIADRGNARSWAARSRSRVATGLVLTAPGIPMLFMGQEVLEDKNWSDNPQWAPETLVWWEGVETDRAMRDHLRFTRDLAALRHRLPALRGEPLRVLHVHNDNRVIAVHRWLEGAGRDVLVVASLNDATFWRYEVGFPRPGLWAEVFNSDAYDHFPNPWVAGNGGAVEAAGPGVHGCAHSAALVIPANAVLVFEWVG